jgi:hypothetical protein
VPHVVLISAHRTDEDLGDAPTLTVVRAKRTADAHLRSQRSLRWTIVRPDALSDEEPTGLVRAGDRAPRGVLPRADLAAVVVEALTANGSSAQCELTGDLTPLHEAVRRSTWAQAGPLGRTASRVRREEPLVAPQAHRVRARGGRPAEMLEL